MTTSADALRAEWEARWPKIMGDAKETEEFVEKLLEQLAASRIQGSEAPPWNEALTACHQRLQAFIREHRAGGCKRFSLGIGCTCPLCDADYLLAAAAPRAVEGALRDAATAVVEQAELSGECEECFAEVCRGAGHIAACNIGKLASALSRREL